MFDYVVRNPKYVRYIFFFLLFSCIFLNHFILKDARNFYILYIFCAIFLGIGFYNDPLWIIFLLTTLLVICRFFLIPDPSQDIVTFITYMFTYLLIAMITVGLMKNVQKVKEKDRQLTRVLANALVSRDSYTSHHSENVAKYSLEIAEEMNLSKEMCDSIYTGALLHDIGKIGIPEHILNKNGNLTDQEYSTIKNHPQIGYNIIKDVTTFKENGVSDIVLYHHERYDGKGYPAGLKEDEIPLTAKIVALADAFDAMSSKRCYKDQLEHEYILDEINKGKGTQFDPQIVDIFLRSLKQRESSKE